MNEYVDIELGAEGIQYVKERLELGMTLSRFLLQICDFNNGTAKTLLPPNVSKEAVKQFEYGGKLKQVTQYVPTTRFWLVSEIQKFLTGGEKRLCVFEEALWKPSDPCVVPYRNKILTYMNEVYHYLSFNEAQQEEIISQVVRRADSDLFIGIFTSIPDDSSFASGGRELSLDELRLYAERAEQIVVGAYDGESYVIWHRINRNK